MARLAIYSKNGAVRASAEKWKFFDGMMNEQYVMCTIRSEKPVPFAVGDYCEFRGERYVLSYIPTAKQRARTGTVLDAYTYDDVKFCSVGDDELSACTMLDVVSTEGEWHEMLGTNYTGSATFQLFCGNTVVGDVIYPSVCVLMAKIEANLNRKYGSTGFGKWTIHVNVTEIKTEDKVLSFDNTTVTEAMAEVHNTFGLNYCIRGRHIHVGYDMDGVWGELPHYGYGKGFPSADGQTEQRGLFEIEREADSRQQIVTRLRVLGSSKNLPYRYYNEKYHLSQALFPLQLQLPDTFLPYGDASTPGTKAYNNAHSRAGIGVRAVLGDTNDAYIDKDDNAEQSAEGVREASIRFDGSDGELEDIYPTIEKVTFADLRAANVEDQDGNTGEGSFPGYDGDENIDEILVVESDANQGDGILNPEGTGVQSESFHIVIKDMGFDLTATFIDGEMPVVAIKSGDCVAREFEIGDNVERWEDPSTGKKGYRLTLFRAKDDSLNTYYPNNVEGSGKLYAGAKFVLLHINMPDAYVESAELRLLRAATDWLAVNSVTRFTYKPQIDGIYLQRDYDRCLADEHPENSILYRLYAGLHFTFKDIPVSEGSQVADVNITIEQLTIEMGDGLVPKVDIKLNDDIRQSVLEKITASVSTLSQSTSTGIDRLVRYLNDLFTKDTSTDPSRIRANYSLYTNGHLLGMAGVAAGGITDPDSSGGGGGGTAYTLSGDISAGNLKLTLTSDDETLFPSSEVNVSAEGLAEFVKSGTALKLRVTDANVWGAVSGHLLDDGKINPTFLPDYILGQVMYGGSVNGSGVCTLTQSFKDKYGVTTLTLTAQNASSYEGVYFIASDDGTSGVPQTLGVVTGDWIISNGTAWTKIDNTDAVTGVKGDAESVYRTGNINITKGNIGLGNVEDKSSATIRSEITASDIPSLDANKITTGTFADERIASADTWNAKYDKPGAGIPLADLAAGVQASLGKADSAVQKTDVNLVTGSDSANDNFSVKLTIKEVTKKLTGIRLTGDTLVPAIIRNVVRDAAGDWSCGLGTIQVDGSGKFTIGAVGTYALEAQNGLTYAYLGCNVSNGLNLRITASALTWGTDTIWHAGNSNKIDVDWSAKNLTLAGSISGATTIEASGKIHTTAQVVGDSGVAAGGITDPTSSGGGGGSVDAVKVNDVTYNPDASGVVELPNYYNKTESDTKYATKTALQTTNIAVGALDARLTTDEQNISGMSTDIYNLKGYFTNGKANDALKLGGVTAATIEDCIKSLQSQVDSVSARDSFDELIAGALFADVLVAKEIHSDSLSIYATQSWVQDKHYVASIDGRHPDAQGYISVDGYFTDRYSSPTQDVYRLVLFGGGIELPFVNLSSTHTTNDWGLWSKADVAQLISRFSSIDEAIAGKADASDLANYLLKTEAASTYVTTQRYEADLDDFMEKRRSAVAGNIAVWEGTESYGADGSIKDSGTSLSSIESGLQSLQSQIDSVASRDSFDELTATSLFADTFVASDIDARRLLCGEATFTDPVTLESGSAIYAHGDNIIQKHSVGQILGIASGPDRIDIGAGTQSVYAISLWGTNLYFNTKRVLTADDLNDNATKTWVNNQGYITASALTGYATQSWVEGKGYLTQHQDITPAFRDDYGPYHNQYVLELVGASTSFCLLPFVDIANYDGTNWGMMSKADVTSLRNTFSSMSAVINSKADASDLVNIEDCIKSLQSQVDSVASRYRIDEVIEDYQLSMQAWVEGKGYVTPATLSNYYTSSQSNDRFSVVDGLEAPPTTSRQGKPGDFVAVRQNNDFKLYVCLGQVYTSTWLWREVLLAQS